MPPATTPGLFTVSIVIVTLLAGGCFESRRVDEDDTESGTKTETDSTFGSDPDEGTDSEETETEDTENQIRCLPFDTAEGDPVINDTEAFTTVDPSCRHAPSEYVHMSAEGCHEEPFNCPIALSVFVDGCGCGCCPPYMDNSRPLADAESTCRAPIVPTECNGVVGRFAFFERGFTDAMMVEDNLYFWIRPYRHETLGRLWRVRKRTGDVSLVTNEDENELISTPGVGTWIVSNTQFPTKNFVYRLEDGWIIRTSSSDAREKRLFPVPEEDEDSLAFLVVDDEFYLATNEGALWYADLGAETIATELIRLEQRGPYADFDDYNVPLGVDDDAVYWQAGADTAIKTTDSDPLAIYRTCRVTLP